MYFSIYTMLKNLISNKFYKTKEEIIVKLNVFYAHNVISEEEYSELVELTNEMYN